MEIWFDSIKTFVSCTLCLVVVSFLGVCSHLIHCFFCLSFGSQNSEECMVDFFNLGLSQTIYTYLFLLKRVKIFVIAWVSVMKLTMIVMWFDTNSNNNVEIDHECVQKMPWCYFTWLCVDFLKCLDFMFLSNEKLFASKVVFKSNLRYIRWLPMLRLMI